MTAATTDWDRLCQQISQIQDPEIPVVSIADLGVLRGVERDDDGLRVTITPTYSGCPALDSIADEIRRIGQSYGYPTTVHTVFSPAWSTDWMSESARHALGNYGIAPPRVVGSAHGAAEGGPGARAVTRAKGEREVAVELAALRCPRCGATNTSKITDFGSTACKALYRCDDCLEPFDHFKEI